MTNSSKITARIRALLAKANSTGYDAEADAFAAKAAALALRHAIDLSTIGSDDDSSDFVTIIHDAPKGLFNRPKRSLLNSMCESLGVFLYGSSRPDGFTKTGRRRPRVNTLHLCGRKSTVETVWAIYLSLCVQADQELLAYDPPIPNIGGGDTPSWLTRRLAADRRSARAAFIGGYVSTVADRWAEQHDRAEAEVPGVGLMMASDFDQAKRITADAGIQLGETSVRFRSNAAGIAAGNRARLGGPSVTAGQRSIGAGR